MHSTPKRATHTRTLSILQRLPVILAVTAASYGLAQPQALGRGQGAGAAASGQHRTAAAGPAHSRLPG